MSTQEPQVELYVRADTFGTGDQQRQTLDRLRTLESDDVVDAVTVTTWQSRVRLDAPDTEDEMRAIERFRALERWANREGVALDPFFETWERYSEIEDRTYEELVTPVMCLVVTRDGAVETVAPRRDGDEVTTVQDCLSRLESPTDETETTPQVPA